jgi:hypothetical protein
MADAHMQIFTFCVFYIICFTALFSLTPLGTFPPRDITITVPGINGVIGGFTWTIPWVDIMATLCIIALSSIIAIVIIGDVSAVTVSLNINTQYLCTIIVGVVFSLAIGVTLTQMMPPMPLIPQFFLVWIWCIFLVYSVIMYAGAGHNA